MIMSMPLATALPPAIKAVDDDILMDHEPIDKLLERASWKSGEKVPYEALCKAFEAIEATTKRLEITRHLTNLLRQVIALSPDNLVQVVYLCINRLAPAYEGIELGLGENILMKVLASATGRQLAKIKSDYEQHGDLGLVAQLSRNTQPTMFAPPRLSVPAVYKTLKEIASYSGHAMLQKKIDSIQRLLVACRGSEAKFLVRSLEGKLRIGLAEQTLISSLSQSFELHYHGRDFITAAQTMKQMYAEMPNYDVLVPHLLSQTSLSGVRQLCKLSAGIPVRPMLAQPTKSVNEVLEKFEGKALTCEYKYDGERCQIHRSVDGDIRIYSRNLENMTGKYPDLMERLGKASQSVSYILDCEAVAIDKMTNQILPFQILSTRKRKDVNADDVRVQVCLFAFDLILIDGESLLQVPLLERRRRLHEHFVELEGQFQFARYMDTCLVDDMQLFLEDAIKNSCEGLMVKTLEQEATYEPARRSMNWLKVKKDYLDGMGDSVDLVVLGAYQGKGKRTGVYGGFLLFCYDPERESYQSICKLGTGFSEADLETHVNSLKEHVIEGPKSYYQYDEGLVPDVWFDASQVWEVKAADLSVSPVHKAAIGLVDARKGISLRFPRFLRVRDDKTPEEATTADQVADMYRKQNLHTANGSSSQAADADDGYDF